MFVQEVIITVNKQLARIDEALKRNDLPDDIVTNVRRHKEVLQRVERILSEAIPSLTGGEGQ